MQLPVLERKSREPKTSSKLKKKVNLLMRVTAIHGVFRHGDVIVVDKTRRRNAAVLHLSFLTPKSS